LRHQPRRTAQSAGLPKRRNKAIAPYEGQPPAQ
jgi:hypothetical protein